MVPLSSLCAPTVPNTPASDSYQRVDDRARASSADDLKLPAHVLFRKDLSLILWKPRGVLDQSTVNEIVAFIEAVEIRCARRAYCLRVASSSYNASTGALRHGNAMPSEADCLLSWNCILVPGVICNFPAVTPCRAWRAVPGRLPGSALFVFTATLLPFTEIDVSSYQQKPNTQMRYGWTTRGPHWLDQLSAKGCFISSSGTCATCCCIQSC